MMKRTVLGSWGHPYPRSLVGWVKEFSLLCPKSALPLIRAVVKKARSKGLTLLFPWELLLSRALSAVLLCLLLVWCLPGLHTLALLPGLPWDLPPHWDLAGWSRDCTWPWGPDTCLVCCLLVAEAIALACLNIVHHSWLPFPFGALAAPW